jgi:hypothetical protein
MRANARSSVVEDAPHRAHETIRLLFASLSTVSRGRIDPVVMCGMVVGAALLLHLVDELREGGKLHLYGVSGALVGQLK